MRIACCHCGPRGNEEFTYLGDATVRRPGPIGDRGQTPVESGSAISTASGRGSDPIGTDTTFATWHDYVYLRDNPAGLHRELWQHTGGCRIWLVVTRNTRSHEIASVEPARDVALARAGTRHE